MKALKWIGLSLLALIVLVILVSLFLPSKVNVERSIVINTTADVPFDLINDLKKWEGWSPWHGIDPKAVWEFSENAVGADAWYTWKSEHPNVGNGKLTITESKPHELIVTKLEFEDMSPSIARYIFTKEGEGTKVTWTLESDMGMNPIGKIFGLFMDKMIGPDYEKGLAGLKKLSESAPKKEKILGYVMEMKNMPATQYVFISNKDVKMEQIGMKIGDGLMKLDAYIKESGNECVGYPFTVWYSPSVFNVALPVKTETSGKDNIKYQSEKEFKALVVKYYGAYEKNMPVYEAMENYIKEKGMVAAGPPQEVYVTDPMMEKDTAKWLTEMVFPVTGN